MTRITRTTHYQAETATFAVHTPLRANASITIIPTDMELDRVTLGLEINQSNLRTLTEIAAAMRSILAENAAKEAV